MSGPGPGPNWTVAKLAVSVVMKREQSTYVRLNGKLPTGPNWAGSQRVTQRVQLFIHIKLFYWQCVNSILSKSCFRQTIMRFCMFCSLQYRFIWYLCFTFDIWFICLSRGSTILLHRRRFARRLDCEICKTWCGWRSVHTHIQDAAGSMSLLFLPVKAADIWSMDVCKKSEHKLPNMAS